MFLGQQERLQYTKSKRQQSTDHSSVETARNRFKYAQNRKGLGGEEQGKRKGVVTGGQESGTH